MGSLVLLKVILSVPNMRSTSISAGYRPDWVSDEKPAYDCAVVWLISEPIPPGTKTAAAILQPMRPELWESVKRGTELRAMEGSTHVATAKVLSVYRTL